MTPLSQSVLAALTAEPNDWPVRALAEDLGVSPQVIRASIRELNQAGFAVQASRQSKAVSVLLSLKKQPRTVLEYAELAGITTRYARMLVHRFNLPLRCIERPDLVAYIRANPHQTPRDYADATGYTINWVRDRIKKHNLEYVVGLDHLRAQVPGIVLYIRANPGKTLVEYSRELHLPRALVRQTVWRRRLWDFVSDARPRRKRPRAKK